MKKKILEEFDLKKIHKKLIKENNLITTTYSQKLEKALLIVNWFK